MLTLSARVGQGPQPGSALAPATDRHLVYALGHKADAAAARRAARR
jgi:hypothetical protein